MKAVVVILLSWNKPQQVIDCLDRVRALTGADIHAVVVDNASSDDSVARIRHAHPDATLLAQTINHGFAGGVNRGLAEAARRGADYVWLLNDDTVFDDDILALLLAATEAAPTSGLLSPLLLDLGSEAVEQFRNGLIDWSRGTMRHNVPDAIFSERLAEGATAIVPATALLCDLRVYRAIGGFDERYFVYWEDTDYAVRAARAGYVSRVVETAIVRHAATPTRHARPPHYHYYMVRNEALMWRLHAGPGVGWKRLWLARSLEWMAQNRDLGRLENAQACIDGIWHGWTERYGPRAKHRPAPAWLSRLLIARPWFFFQLAHGDVGTLFRRLRVRG